MPSALTSEMRHGVSRKEGPSQVPLQSGQRGPGPPTQPRVSLRFTRRCGRGSGQPRAAQAARSLETSPPHQSLQERSSFHAGGRSLGPQPPLGTRGTKAATGDRAPATSSLGFLSSLFIFPPGRPLPGAWSQSVGEGGERMPCPRGPRGEQPPILDTSAEEAPELQAVLYKSLGPSGARHRA